MQRAFLRSRSACASASLAALAIAWCMPAHAQATPGIDEAATPTDSVTAASADTSDQDIIVTGTLLRGIAPVGTNVVSVSRADVVATGATSANDLLTNIPQIGNFNTIPNGGANFGQPIVQTNLRNLGASGGTTTLTLLNGHRVVGSGILQTYVDPQIIPPALIERVEVIPDGGSSIYGSDAIGGVINFITRKRFNGVEGIAHYGFADGYNTADANVTIGKDWGSGSLSVSYSYAWHNEILGRERDYVRTDYRSLGGADSRSFSCTPGNIRIGATFLPMPSFSGAPNRCDTTDNVSIYPRESRHAVFATLDQDLNDSITVNVTAYFARRDTKNYEATLAGSGLITSSNPYFRPGPNGETSYTAFFDFSPVFGVGRASPQRFDSWGVTPSFEADLGDDWHLRGMFNFGHSWNQTIQGGVNAGAIAAGLAGTTTATALNPYNIAQTNSAVLAAIANYRDRAQAKQELVEGRLVADGALLTLPAGDVRLAVGAEYHVESIDANVAFGSLTTPFTNRAKATRKVGSVFGELFVPVFKMLDITGSIRYDQYDDVGGTTNPKIGFNLRPIQGLTIRGNYGTSFHAPSLADTVGAVDARISATTAIGYTAGQPLIWISGGSATLRPETAKTWSLGADFRPAFVPSLTLSATYYNIDFTDIISVNAGGFFGSFFYADPLNAPFFIRNPTIAQVNAFSGNLQPDNFASLASLYASSGTPYAVLDLRRYNRGRLKQDGIDFNAVLNHPTSFGSINASFGGTYTLHRKTSDNNNGVYTNVLLNGVGRFNFTATLGATAGPLTGRGQWTHRGGYPILFDTTQSRVGSYDVFDLYFALDLEKMGLMKSTSLTLNVDNVFDKDPPFRTATNGYANGSTFGRLFQFGLRTKF